MNFNEVVEKDWDKVPPMEYWEELMRVSEIKLYGVEITFLYHHQDAL